MRAMMKWSDNKNWEHPIDDKPTNELPGTQAKIEVMRDRVSREKCPHHPDDARYDEAVIERIIQAMVEIGGVANKAKGRR